MITMAKNMIEDKAKELNIKIKEWIKDNRPLKIKVEGKDTNLLKELYRGLISQEFHSTLITLMILVSLINRDYEYSLVSSVALIALCMQDIASSIRHRSKR